MSEFKVGDWVRDSLDFNSVYQIKDIEGDYIETYSKDCQFIGIDRMLYLTDGTEYLRIIGSSFVFKPEEIAYETILRGKSSIPLAILNDAIIEGEQKIYFLDECEVWQPQEGEWCWFNMEFLDGWQNPVLMRYGEQDTSRWNIEPFVGNLPNFIKEQ